MVKALLESVGWGLRGLVKALARAIWALIRPALKVASVVALLGAIVALTGDVTRWQTGAGGPLFLSIADIMTQTAPATFTGLGSLVSTKLHPLVWDPVLSGLLSLPAWGVRFAVALGAGWWARERRQVDIFIN